MLSAYSITEENKKHMSKSFTEVRSKKAPSKNPWMTPLEMDLGKKEAPLTIADWSRSRR